MVSIKSIAFGINLILQKNRFEFVVANKIEKCLNIVAVKYYAWPLEDYNINW